MDVFTIMLNIHVLQQCANLKLNSIDRLVIVLIRLVIDHVEEPQLVCAGGSRDDTEPVAELLLLEVLEVSARKLLVRNNLDLALSLLADGNGLAQVAGPAVDLYALVEELLKGGDIENLVRGRLGAVDNELVVISIDVCFRVHVMFVPSSSPCRPSCWPGPLRSSTLHT
ncbi:hypothetical protein MRB53_037533 [Persea americana]|nr:hypothetical protein MRB53_037533 [Persea americana]